MLNSIDSIDTAALPALKGFDGGPGVLPPERSDVPLSHRERAAALVLAIGRMHTPEEAVNGAAAASLAALQDPFEREEALAWVDLLLDALVPREQARRCL